MKKILCFSAFAVSMFLVFSFAAGAHAQQPPDQPDQPVGPGGSSPGKGIKAPDTHFEPEDMIAGPGGHTTTDIVKDFAQTMADAAAGASVGYGAIAAFGAAIGNVAVATGFGLLCAQAAANSYMWGVVAKDPPRSDFRENTSVEQSHVTVPELPASLKSVSDMISEWAAAYDLSRAELLAIERYSGAQKAGDQESAQKQLKAAVRFKQEADASMSKLQGLTKKAAAAIRSSGEDSTFQRSKVTAAAKDNVFKSAEKTMQELGTDEKTIEDFKSSLSGTEMDKMDGKKISDMLESTSSSLKTKKTEKTKKTKKTEKTEKTEKTKHD